MPLQPCQEPGEFSRYSDGLRAARPKFDSRQKQHFLYFTASRLALRPTQPPIQGVPGPFLGVKSPGHEIDHWPPPSAEPSGVKSPGHEIDHSPPSSAEPSGVKSPGHEIDHSPPPSAVKNGILFYFYFNLSIISS
jgi:hypothetical protein